MDALEDVRSMWADKATIVDNYLTARKQARLSAQIICAAKAMQQETRIKSKITTLLGEQGL